jgi:hypothetical protein
VSRGGVWVYRVPDSSASIFGRLIGPAKEAEVRGRRTDGGSMTA